MWETQALCEHYHPDVAASPALLQIPALGKREFDVEKSCKMTYGLMISVRVFC